jgi:hypothetical protein
MDLNWARTNLRKRNKYLITMTVISKYCHDILKKNIIVQGNILKLDLIYLLWWDQRCYVYVFIFIQSVQQLFLLDRFGQQADEI